MPSDNAMHNIIYILGGVSISKVATCGWCNAVAL